MKINKKNEKLNEVKRYYEDNGCVLVSEEYKNSITKMEFTCRCGRPYEKTFENFQRSPRCKECFRDEQSKSKSFTIDKVQKGFKDRGCTLITDTYINAWQMLDYICICGEPSKIQYACFIKGVRCNGCLSKRNFTEEKVEKIVEDAGCIYISQDGIESTSKVFFECRCGDKSEKTIMYFIRKSICNDCSRKIAGVNRRGENASNWNPLLTDEDRERSRSHPEYTTWRNNVFERDNYTCLICHRRGVALNAHHRDAYHWCKERRIDVSNGATLCNECHNIEYEYSFHSIYGNRNNTEEQFNEWMKVYQSLILNERSA